MADGRSAAALGWLGGEACCGGRLVEAVGLWRQFVGGCEGEKGLMRGVK